MNTNKITDKQLDTISLNASQLKLYVIREIKDRDSEDRQSFIDDVLDHGCVSGIVSDLIYYVDTVKFYSNHREDIWAQVLNDANDHGESSLQYIAHFVGTAINTDNEFKNALAWYAFERTVSIIGAELDELVNA